MLLPLLVIAVDEVAFAMNQEVESAGGSDTMKRKKRNRRERESRRAIVYFLVLNQSEYNHIYRRREASSRVF